MERTSRVSQYHVSWPQLITRHSSLLSSGRVKPVCYAEKYSLENIADGLRAIEERRTWGKAIVRVQEDRDSKAIRTKL